MIFDIVMFAATAVFLGAWLWRGAPVRSVLLALAAGAVLAAAAAALLHGRWQAAPVLAVAVVMAGIAFITFRRHDSGRAQGTPWLSGAVLAGASLLALSPVYMFPVFALPAPSGPHSVGVRDFDMTDATRTGVGRSPPGEARRLFVRVWYPATPNPGSAVRPYASEDEIATVYSGLANTFGLPAFFFDHLGMVRTHSHEAAPVDGSAGPYPVVFFSHGFSSFASQNTALMEELASRGYVVISSAHTWDSPVVRFTDGSIAAAGPPEINERSEDNLAVTRQMVLSSDNDARMEGFLASQHLARRDGSAFAASIGTWLADRLFLKRVLAAGDAPLGIQDVLAVADFSRVAHAGMSFGGTTSGGACLADPDCAAAINLDGADYHGAADMQMPAPFLMLHADWRRMPALMGVDTPADPGKGFNDFSYERFDTAGQTPGVHRVRVRDLDHLGISDLGLMLRRPARDVLAGPQDGGKVAAILNDFVGDFLDHYVRRLENGFPETVLARHSADVDRHDAGHVREWWAAKSDLERERILADINQLNPAHTEAPAHTQAQEPAIPSSTPVTSDP